MKKGVYAGSFDPITNGHIWMIEQGAELFDQFVVAIGTNPAKHYTFSEEERAEMLHDAIAKKYSNVVIDTFQKQFLVDYASSIQAKYMLRGIRTEGDYEYERGMRHLNNDLNSEIVTVFLIPPREIAEISSSTVKGLVGPNGWQKVVSRYVPSAVLEKFSQTLAKQGR